MLFFNKNYQSTFDKKQSICTKVYVQVDACFELITLQFLLS